MPMIPFAEWRPDMPHLGPWAREALNVVPDEESYRPLNGLAGVSAPLDARCQGAAWFRGTHVRREGRIESGGLDRDVMFVDADPEINDKLDAAYRTKYRRYAASIVNSIVSAKARATTIKLVPHSKSS